MRVFLRLSMVSMCCIGFSSEEKWLGRLGGKTASSSCLRDEGWRHVSTFWRSSRACISGWREKLIFRQHMWYVATLSISFKKCKPSRDREKTLWCIWSAVISSTMHCQCLPRAKRQKSSAPSGTQWNLFALLSWKDATIYLEILLIIISNIWRMCSHGETFCFLQKIQENTEHSSDEKSFRAHIG